MNECCSLIMPDKDEEMPGELLKVFPANNLQMMFLSGAKGTQVSSIALYCVMVNKYETVDSNMNSCLSSSFHK